MVARTLVLFFIVVPGPACGMGKEEKLITHRLVKICYEALKPSPALETPVPQEKPQYMSAINVNNVILNNDGKFHFIPVFNNKLYLRQENSSPHQGNVIQSALKALFETKKITINPTQEVICIEPIRLHNNQQGNVVLGKYEGINLKNGTEKIQWIIINLTNKISSSEGYNFFNGIYIPDKKTATIRAPDGHILIEAIDVQSTALKNLPSSGYLKLWTIYYRKTMNMHNNYLDTIASKIIKAPYPSKQCEAVFIPSSITERPAPLVPDDPHAVERFEQTFFNYLPNELLEKIRKYLEYNSYKTCIQKNKQNYLTLELKNDIASIPSFESLSVEKTTPQTPLQMQ